MFQSFSTPFPILTQDCTVSPSLFATTCEQWRVHVTRSKGHARSLAERAALAGADLIAAVGGDGTLNEVVDGIMRAGILGPDGLPRATVTVLPLGTASDFHRSMAWTPNDFEEAMWRIGNRGETAVLDVGRIVCESRSGPVVRHFINVASCGASARAAMRLHKWKWLGECARYRLAAFAALFKYKRRTVGVRIDGGDWRRVRDASLIAVGNGAYFGHGLNICPDANPYDGKLQVVTASGMGPLAFLMQAWRLRMGRHLDQHGITAEDATHRVDVALWSQRSFLPEINYQPLPLAGSNPAHSPSAMSLDTLSSSSPGTVGVSTPAGSFTEQERPPRVASAPSSPATTVQQDPSETASNGSGPCSAPSGARGGASQAGRRDGDDAEREECDDSESGESTTSWPRARRGRREEIAAQPPSPASSLSARTHCTEVRSEHRQAAIQRNLRYSKASKASKSDANIQKVDLNPEDYGPVPVEVDGEVIGHAPFCITLLPGAIKVRVQGVNLK
jgi:diacylglycerol kinase family enzyme